MGRFFPERTGNTMFTSFWLALNYAAHMNIQTLRQAVTPHLPGPADPSGVPVARLMSACQANLANPDSVDPYPADLKDTAKVNRDLQELARGAECTVGQLAAATSVVQAEATEAAAQAAADKKELRSDYFKQVGCTTAWMAATAGTLVLGGLFPNPISLIIVGGACVGTIRSINKARAKHKELVQQTPLLEANIKASKELAAGAGFYGPLVAGWDELLKQPPQSRAA